MDEQNDQSGAIPDRDDLPGTDATAVHGYVIPRERMAEAQSQVRELMGFLDQLSVLDIGTGAPASVFDPSWDKS